MCMVRYPHVLYLAKLLCKNVYHTHGIVFFNDIQQQRFEYGRLMP